ncbi:MAG: oligosaccharide repeat unit polymerase [Lachnospiraceae bacterium]|nr:oligosaccharide repeat unit polymerase [Lachnospiraceae bacterium]
MITLWIIAAVLLGILAVGLYVVFERIEKNLVAMPALLSLFWLGGIAVACLKLSNLSHDSWKLLTWCSFLGFYLFFLGGYYLYRFLREKGKRSVPTEQSKRSAKENEVFETGVSDADPEGKKRILGRLFVCLVVMTVLPFAAMCLEWAVLGFLPALVKNTPHAYSYFHITGVHYFTVSSVMVHPLTLLYLYWDRERFLSLWNSFRKKGENVKPLKEHKKDLLLLGVLTLMNVIAISVPILCVSRYFLIMSVALTMVTFFSLKKLLRPKNLILLLAGCFLVLVPMYVLLTVLRAHSVEYLNEIFDMKNPNTPIFVTQPYMYIANNYENFDCLVRELPAFALGLRQCFPLFALTGLKFVLGDVLVGTIYTTKVELTTLTVIYDAYYDFGVIGVFLFGGLLGAFCSFITEKTLKNRNPLSYLIYAQVAMYLVLSFFTTWFSNPTTWFWLIMTGCMYLFAGWKHFPTDKWFLKAENKAKKNAKK